MEIKKSPSGTRTAKMDQYNLEGFSVERVMTFLTALGSDIEIRVHLPKRSTSPGEFWSMPPEYLPGPASESTGYGRLRPQKFDAVTKMCSRFQAQARRSRHSIGPQTVASDRPRGEIGVLGHYALRQPVESRLPTGLSACPHLWRVIAELGRSATAAHSRFAPLRLRVQPPIREQAVLPSCARRAIPIGHIRDPASWRATRFRPARLC